MPKSHAAYIVIAHGSREPKSGEAFNSFLDAFRNKVHSRKVVGAYLELNKPTIPEAIEECILAGDTEIFIAPLMLFPGRHVKDDIPKFIQEAKAKHPEIDFHYAGPLADDPKMLDLLESKINQMSS